MTRPTPATHADHAAELRRIRRRLEDAIHDLERSDLTVIDLRRIDAEMARVRAAVTDLDEGLDERWETVG